MSTTTTLYYCYTLLLAITISLCDTISPLEPLKTNKSEPQSQDECRQSRLRSVKTLAQSPRGVNLGNWLILESWMGSKPWTENNCDRGSNPGTYLLERCLRKNGEAKVRQVMERHWSTWITKEDFKEMSDWGVNLVRLPIGWWQIYDAQGGVQSAKLNQYITPKDYVSGGLKYIDLAFEWGAKYGIAVLLDMHAAPGSQNGNEHSSPSNPGQIYWDKYPANVNQTVDSMALYAQRYHNHSALFGFCLLNEPAHNNLTILQDYYRRATVAIRTYSNDSYIVLNPLITPFESGTESHWIDFLNDPKVAMDLHYYSCFGGPPDQANADGAINYVRYDRKGQVDEFKVKNPGKLMLIGEWSACGHFDGNRTGDFARVQVEVYSGASMGWTYWSWADGSEGNVWSLKTAFKYGWLQKFYPC